MPQSDNLNLGSSLWSLENKSLNKNGVRWERGLPACPASSEAMRRNC